MSRAPRALLRAAALAALAGCTPLEFDRASPVPNLVAVAPGEEMGLFVYTDRDGLANLPDRRGYSLRFPVVEAARTP